MFNYLFKQIGGQLSSNKSITTKQKSKLPLQLFIQYENNEVEPGMNLGQLEVANQPIVYYPPDIGQGPYTLVVVDPDSPDPKNPIYKEWIQWMMVNIPKNKLNQGQTVLPYSSPTPPLGTHRYIFYLYDQMGKVLPPDLTYTRQGFNRSTFLWKYGIFAAPLAMNYFMVSTLNEEGVNLNL
tara:strand:- start:23204 stop:23746 length:543 start_codon:yes stop_codon:yes gene_type:complete